MLYHVGGLAGKSNMEVSLKPEYENGIIFYIGARDDGRGDFASLALINGFVEFRYAGYSFHSPRLSNDFRLSNPATLTFIYRRSGH